RMRKVSSKACARSARETSRRSRHATARCSALREGGMPTERETRGVGCDLWRVVPPARPEVGMKVLFIGGTGIISSACARRAIASGVQLDLMCRGNSPRARPEGAGVPAGDVLDLESARALLGDRSYDAVVDFVAFTPEHVERDLALFRDRARQYVFISSASAYHKPVRSLPITEATPLHNPFWKYSRDKIACEQLL